MSSAFLPPKKSQKVKTQGEIEREYEEEDEEETNIQQVSIASIDVTFVGLVFLLVKLSLAAIPAAIILAIFWVFVGGVIWDLL